MSAAANQSSVVALDRLFDPRDLTVDAASGTLKNSLGDPMVGLTRECTRAMHHVMLREKSGTWREIMLRTGRSCGRELAAKLDSESALRGAPALAALPLETCLGHLQRAFAAQGWGRLTIDLTAAAEHGLVVAHLEDGYFPEALSDTSDFADPFPAGLLQGFFEHISGEQLGCLEIACVRRGAARCTFVITAAERLAALAPFVGVEGADALLARLKV